MGYCYITGKLKKGHITFDKCDGRSSICVVDNPTKKQQKECKRIKKISPDDVSCLPYANISRCNECFEYGKDYKEALGLFRDWLLSHRKGIRRNEYGLNTQTCLSWAEKFIGDFRRLK